MVAADKLVEVATALRDESGYDYLSTRHRRGLLAGPIIEVVYHACSHAPAGRPLVFKVAGAARGNPIVPSLVAVWPGADFQEREAYDLFGIRFTGHPNLRRILMWEGFEGHPLRKDWQEAYYEEETKPFKSRWPDGQFYSDRGQASACGNNVQVPARLRPGGLRQPEGDAALYADHGADRCQQDGNGRRTSRPTADRQPGPAAPQHPRRVPHGGRRWTARRSSTSSR